MELSRAEREALADLVRTLREELRAQEVLLYGSAARGELEEGSDIDLVILLPRVNWAAEKRVAEHCFAAQLRCGRVVSAVCFTRRELQGTALRASPFVQHVLRQGKPL